jgi:hypothetical protein
MDLARLENSVDRNEPTNTPLLKKFLSRKALTGMPSTGDLRTEVSCTVLQSSAFRSSMNTHIGGFMLSA